MTSRLRKADALDRHCVVSRYGADKSVRLTISKWLDLLIVLGLLGCASGEKQSEGVIVTPGGSMPGTVISVNPSARFAVLRFPIGQLPPLDQRMSAYRKGLKVADLRISGPQRDVHTVADVLAGECQVGDDVRAD